MAMLDTIREERIEKVNRFKELGLNPYPSKSGRTNTSAEITNDFDKFEGKEVCVSGRLMTMRDFGKLRFARLKDGSGEIQLVIRPDELTNPEQLELYDIGDFVDAKGEVAKTKTGEISVNVKSLRLLSKALRPLPEKWSGLKDEDERFRKRYLDFLANQSSKDKILVRTKLLKFWREFMWEKGFIEIENPTLEVTAAGAEARPFITHLNAYNMDVYLRIAGGELWQKMSTIGGFEKVFEICRVYRNEGVDAEHNPEFTMMEFYWAFATIEDNIKLHEEMFSRMTKEIKGSFKFTYKGKEIDMTPPYPVIRYVDKFKELSGIDLEEYSDLKELQKAGLDKGVDLQPSMGWYATIDTIFKRLVRPNIINPVFLTDYPYIMTPLAKRNEKDDRYVQMSQLIIDGMEMCRIYGELNDPLDQAERFKEQKAGKTAGDEQAWESDDTYVEAMEYGMPPQTGSGIGFDRWVKVLTDSESLREVIAYPIMKPESSAQTVAVPIANSKLNADFRTVFEEFGISTKDIEVPTIQGNDYLSMTKEFKATYPTASAGYAIIEGVKIESQLSEEFIKLQSKIFALLRGITKAEIDSSPRLRSYRDMYKSMGIDYRSRKPSPEALLHRISQGQELYKVNSMVDAYNLAVITSQISAGAFNLDALTTPIVIDLAKGGESIELIGGTVKELKAGEVAYFDAAGPYNLDYNYRDAERTKISPAVKNVVLNVEGVGEISSAEVLEALKLNIALITKFCGGTVRVSGIVE